jgi:hypothetical protein
VTRGSLLVLLAAILAVGPAGCFGGWAAPGPAPGTTGASPAPTGRLRIIVRLLPGKCGFDALSARCRDLAPAVARYALTCGPAGGTAPNPHAACAAIADYLRRRDRVGGCAGVLAGSGSVAQISGTYGRRRFHLRLTAGYSWCGQPRPILRDYWVLSTFPCSTFVLRTGGDYPRWPRATGCTIDSAPA